MSTKIEWTDETWNLINGCTIVSPGCTNCYAMRWAHRLQQHPNPLVAGSREGLTRVVNGNPVWTGEVLFNRALALRPFEWRKPRKIFVCAHGDLFHAQVPDQWIDYVFMVALANPRHTFQILTKRPERMREYMRLVLDETEEQTAGRFTIAMLHAGLQETPVDKLPDVHWPPRNVWLGTSVEDQRRAEERVPTLLDTPAAVRWLSCEPLLGPVDLSQFLLPSTLLPEWCTRDDQWGIEPLTGRVAPIIQTGINEWSLDGGGGHGGKIDWIVAGGESGSHSRPMHPAWARQLRDACVQAGTAFHFKQWGEWHADALAYTDTNGNNPPPRMRVGKKAAGRELDGRVWDEYPDRAEVASIAGGVSPFSSPAQNSEGANG